jgi:hypothetical protein
MSKPFHVLESLLSSVDGELCRLLKELRPGQTENKQKFDEIWIPHLDTLAELAQMHVNTMEHYSEYLINMNDFDKMCKTIDSMVSRFGIPELKRLPDNMKSLSAMRLSNGLAHIFGTSSTVFNKTKSLDIIPYSDKCNVFPLKFHLNNFITERIEVCDRVIGRFQWYIETLQILSDKFEGLVAQKKTSVVENILKPGCKIFRIPENSTLDQLIQRATNLLDIKEHPTPFSPNIAIAITEMIRESENAKRRTAVHRMMDQAYSSEPTTSNRELRLSVQSPISGARYIPRMGYEEAVIQSEKENAAATKIQRTYRKRKGGKGGKGGKGSKGRKRGKRISMRARQTRNA